MNYPLRVLHCLWKGEIGGAERAVYQLVREQLHDPALAPTLAFGQPGGYYWEQAQAAGIPVISFDLPNGHALARIPAIARIMQGYDILHFQSAEPLLMTVSLFCPGARRIYTHRGGLVDYPLQKRLQYEYVGLLVRFFFHGLSGNTAHAVRSAASLFHLPLRRFQVTYNGLDFDLLRPQRSASQVRDELGLEARHFVIGTSANLRPWKRIERLLQAVRMLDNPMVRLLIVGDGVDRSRLESLTDQLGIRSKIVFAGRQPHIANYLQVMDAFCLPSMGLESFGNAVVEAMALGVPSIVFVDGGGMTEHIVHGETGFVVANQSELERVLRLLIANPELGKEIGLKAQHFIQERYTLSCANAAYRAIYEEVLELHNHA